MTERLHRFLLVSKSFMLERSLSEFISKSPLFSEMASAYWSEETHPTTRYLRNTVEDHWLSHYPTQGFTDLFAVDPRTVLGNRNTSLTKWSIHLV